MPSRFWGFAAPLPALISGPGGPVSEVRGWRAARGARWAAPHYLYDPVYWLIEATGREHQAGAHVQRDETGLPIHAVPHAADPSGLRRYTREYVYDAVGNILEMTHTPASGPPGATWTRTYTYPSTSNQLTSTTHPGGTRSYPHDAHGNFTQMAHLSAINWDFADQMAHVNVTTGQDVHFVYDASGERVRKVYHHSGLIEERIYLGGYEIYRKHTGTALPTATLTDERETLHVADDASRVCMVETLTVSGGSPVGTPTPRYRYQLDNHLATVAVEVDASGTVISYEEYHPYGTSAYRAFTSSYVSARRYRYTGKERDDETGLYYHGARYYAPWLARWTAADPSGMVDGPNLYAYVRGNPVGLRDPDGRTGRSTRFLGYRISSAVMTRTQGNAYQARDKHGRLGWYVDYNAGGYVSHEAPAAPPKPEPSEEAAQMSLLGSPQSGMPEKEMAAPAANEFVPPILDLGGSEVLRTTLGLKGRNVAGNDLQNLPGVSDLTDFERGLRQRYSNAQTTAFVGEGGVVGYWIVHRGGSQFGGNVVDRNGNTLWTVAPKPAWRVGGNYFSILPIPIPGSGVLTKASSGLRGLATRIAARLGRAGRTAGVLEGASFAQRTYNALFSRGGAFAGRSVDDVAAALRSGALNPSDVPINYIVRDGNTLILNTRSAQALEAAGIPRSAWNAVNRTGQDMFETMLTGQLQRNGLTSAGTATVRRSGK